MLSAIVYRPDPKRDKSKLTDKQIKDEADQQRYEHDLQDEGWQRRGKCDRTTGQGRGLYFEVWENDTLQPHRIIFAFRGTRGGPDWGANLRWLRIHRPRDHYFAARVECIPLINEFYNEPGQPMPIISTTGHSLGAGIAQEILYAAADKVDHCIAFDPSPITALHDLIPSAKKMYRQQLNRSEFSQYRIIRAYEKGEILMYARNIVALFHRPDSQTQSIEFYTPERFGAVGKHSITLLANHVRKLAATSESQPDPVEWPELDPPMRPDRAYEQDKTYNPKKHFDLNNKVITSQSSDH